MIQEKSNHESSKNLTAILTAIFDFEEAGDLGLVFDKSQYNGK